VLVKQGENNQDELQHHSHVRTIDKLLSDKNKILKTCSLQQKIWCDGKKTSLLSHLEYDDIDVLYNKIGEKTCVDNNISNEVSVPCALSEALSRIQLKQIYNL
jgi:hypothetical protein